MPVNETHDPNLKSWVESANDPSTDFPIQNLPFCVLRRADDEWSSPKLAVRVGDMLLDIDALLTASVLGEIGELSEDGPDEADMSGYYLEMGPLNRLASGEWERYQNAEAARLRTAGAIRKLLSEVLRAENPVLRDNPAVRESV